MGDPRQKTIFRLLAVQSEPGQSSSTRLSEKGKPDAVDRCFADIGHRYSGAVIAHSPNLPAPEVSDAQDSQNIVANWQVIDITIAGYCAAAGYAAEHRERLPPLRRRMAPTDLVLNLCAFRACLYSTTLRGGND